MMKLFKMLFIKSLWFAGGGEESTGSAGGGEEVGGEAKEEEQQQQTQSTWLDHLPDEMRNAVTLQKFKTPSDLAKSYIEAERLLGRGGVIIPKEGDSAEIIQKYREQMGIPEDSSGYTLPEDIALPENMEIDKGYVDLLLKEAHKNNLSNEQVSSMYKVMLDLQANSLKQIDEQRKETRNIAETNLRKEWGSAYEDKINQAKRVLKSFGDEKLLSELDSSGFGNNPELVKFLQEIGSKISEDTFKGVLSSNKTPLQAKEEIKAIMQDDKNARHKAYFDSNHPAHEEAVKYVSDLYKQAG